MLGMKGDGYYHPKAEEEYTDKGRLSWCKLCGEVRHQAIECHYHLSIMDDKGYSIRKIKLLIQE
jgi:hypothetical protein